MRRRREITSQLASMSFFKMIGLPLSFSLALSRTLSLSLSLSLFFSLSLSPYAQDHFIVGASVFLRDFCSLSLSPSPSLFLSLSLSLFLYFIRRREMTLLLVPISFSRVIGLFFSLVRACARARSLCIYTYIRQTGTLLVMKAQRHIHL